LNWAASLSGEVVTLPLQALQNIAGTPPETCSLSRCLTVLT